MEPLLAYLQFAILAIVLILFFEHYRKKDKFLWNLPVFGMLPEMLLSLHRIYDKVTEILEEKKGTFLVKGAWLGQMDTLVTCDPANVHCVMNSNFSRYHKGDEWRKRFDFFGNHSMFNNDFEEWKQHRNTFRLFLGHQQCHKSVAKLIPDILENRLIPILDQASKQDEVVDLQDLFKSYTLHFAATMATGCNPNFLCPGLPKVPVSEALDDAWEAIIRRHLVPESFWKVQGWLGLEKERKISEGRKIVDRFCAENISRKREKLCKEMTTSYEGEEYFNLLHCYLTGNEVSGPTPSDEVMRDNMINMIFATGDTSSTALTWFFWMLAVHPSVLNKIREELRRNLPTKEVGKCRLFQLEQLGKLIYLHAAICETLRLFPPAPIQIRTPLEAETLPSGHRVDKKTNILFLSYAMARMPWVWGEDCREFRPERWITEEGGIKHEPGHRFFAFNTGPRICLGKDIAFTLMKAVAATIIYNYDFQVLENHRVTPILSVIFRMKNGLKVRVKNTSA